MVPGLHRESVSDDSLDNLPISEVGCVEGHTGHHMVLQNLRMDKMDPSSIHSDFTRCVPICK
jgi:hypothetical protein